MREREQKIMGRREKGPDKKQENEKEAGLGTTAKFGGQGKKATADRVRLGYLFPRHPPYPTYY